MRVALVHDYIKEYGGAERVLEALHELYPDAPVFTSVYLPEFLGPHQDRFSGWDIRESWASRLPWKEKLISPLRLISPLLFRSFDFSGFDVVIVSATGAYTPNSIVCHPERSEGSKKDSSQAQNDIRGTIHISYTHTPPRYLYGFATAREWKKNPFFRVLGETANFFLRIADKKSSQNVDYFIANSKNVASRIQRFYNRESVVIYPPVDTEVFSMKYKVFSKIKEPKYKILNTKYYLAGGRLARPKHIDLIIKACSELEVPLKVFGRGFADYGEELKDLSSKLKVEFVGEVSDEEKFELMKGAKAYIFASEDEDFGITPVEAMSVGLPVIAYRSGGVVESVVDGKTGVFFDELSVESLKKTIEQFNNVAINPKDCVERAKRFSKERFKTEIQLFVNGVYEKNF